MNIGVRFRDLGRVRVRRLREKVAALTEEDWNRDLHRQRNYRVHRETRSVRMLWSEHEHWPEVTTEVFPEFEDFKPVLAPVFEAVTARMGPVAVVNLMLARLDPGCRIPEHMDASELFGHASRMHLPLETGPGVQFTIDGRQVELHRGRLYEVNNRRMHGVVNHSDVPRIHMIFDLLPSQ